MTTLFVKKALIFAGLGVAIARLGCLQAQSFRFPTANHALLDAGGGSNFFVGTVGKILELAGSEAGLDIEVTETLIMDDVESNIRKLEAIRDLGIGIAIDDFGTGYSSLGYLAKLPLEMLKIDRSFIAAMLDDPSIMTLVSTVITLAHSLKLTVIAEGVETEAQMSFLRAHQCDEIQGFYLSIPLAADKVAEKLRGETVQALAERIGRDKTFHEFGTAIRVVC